MTTTAFPQRGHATKDEWLTPIHIIRALGPGSLLSIARTGPIFQ